MHWVIEQGFFREKGMQELIEVLGRYNLPYSTHKVVPLRSGDPNEICEMRDEDGTWVEAVGGLFPAAAPIGSTIVIGAYSMRHIAHANGWSPGVFDLFEFSHRKQYAAWHVHLLNWDARVDAFIDVPKSHWDPFFIRPAVDSKYFAGRLITWDEFWEWRKSLLWLGRDDGTSLRYDTEIMSCSPKKILREYRCWIVDRQVVTASLYKIGDTVRYDSAVEPEVIKYAEDRAAEWSPVRAFVMDIALVQDPDYELGTDLRIIEINTLNAAGLYAANVGRLVEALESMGY